VVTYFCIVASETVLSASNLSKLGKPAEPSLGVPEPSPEKYINPTSPAESYSRTPTQSPAEPPSLKSKKKKPSSSSRSSMCAVFVHAELFIMDIFEDGKAVEESFKQAFASQSIDSNDNK
jgi:hypothetical protein